MQGEKQLSLNEGCEIAVMTHEEASVTIKFGFAKHRTGRENRLPGYLLENDYDF